MNFHRLARNILLFTLIEEDTPSNHLWDIFYHPKLGDHAFRLISTHCRKLAELAETPEAWRQSKYDSFIKLVDASSLAELRRLWTLYAKFPDLSSDRMEKLQKEHEAMSKRISGQAKTSVNMEPSRSAAGAWREAMKPMNEQFAHYWEHGTTVTTNKEIKKTTKLNPTFCYSFLGETFDIYPNTFPEGYHFAPAFTPIESDPVGPSGGSAIAKAKQQFKAGCSAFQEFCRASSIILRFFVGDALALCRALNLYNKTKDPRTGEFSAPWRATPIDLSEHAISFPAAPDSYDVIDFSTLASELGLVNVLVVSQPLLKKQPVSQAVLYTEMPMRTEFSVDVFLERLCGSVPALGTLVGLVPRPYVSLFTSTSNTHELTLGKYYVMHMERIPWVDPCGGDKHNFTAPSTVISFESASLADILFSVYRQMIQFDTMAPESIKKLSHEQRRVFSAPHYTRESVALFFAHVMTRVHVIDEVWEAVATRFMAFVASHDIETSLKPNFRHLQDAFRQQRIPFLRHDKGFDDDVSEAEVFQGWADVPRLVCVVLTVPGKELDAIRQDKSEPSPRLVVNFGFEDETEFIVSSIQPVWGKCVALEGSDGNYGLEEDPEGFRGSSDLVVSFWANAEMFIFPEMTISLSLRKTALVLAEYTKSLGPELNIYTTVLNDKDHVLFLRERPMGLSQTQKTYRYSSPSFAASDGILYVVKTLEDVTSLETDVDTMEARVTLESETDKSELSKADKVTSTQVGPCTLQLSFGSALCILRFPYPIRGHDGTIKLRRASHNITVSDFECY